MDPERKLEMGDWNCGKHAKRDRDNSAKAEYRRMLEEEWWQEQDDWAGATIADVLDS